MPNRRARVVGLIRAYARVKLARPRTRLPRMLQPDAIRLAYAKALQPYADRTYALIKRELYPILPSILETRADASRVDANPLLSAAFERLTRDVTRMLEPKQLYWVAHQFAQRTEDFHEEQFGMMVRAGLGVDLHALGPNINKDVDKFTRENVELIKSIPTQQLAEVQQKVTEGVRSGQRWESMAKTIEERHGVSSNRAKLIARDQVGKFYGELNKKRQEALGVTGYIWRTVNDGRVREEHDDRKGEHFEWSDPPEDGHPGEAINCRCFAEPDFSAIVAGLD